MNSRWLKRTFWILGVLLFVVGLFGWYDRLAHGLRHVNFGSVVTWGLWEAGYIYFVGLSAGSFLISSLVYVFRVRRFESIGRLSVFTALVTLLLALLSIWSGIGHMGRFWFVFVHPNFRSPMAGIIWLYSAYFLLLTAELWFLLRRDMVASIGRQGFVGWAYRVLSFGSRDTSEESERRDRRVVRVLASIGVPLAIMFHGGVGALFGVVAARPFWHSGLYPILFLLSALVSGGALLMVISTVFQDGWHRNRDTVVALGKLVLGLLLLDVLFQFSEFLVGLYGDVPGDVEGLKLVLKGPYWWVFWVWQLVLGTAIPALLLILPTRKNARWASLAGLMIALGFIGVRLNIVIPGLAMEEVRGLARAFVSPRLSTTYFPSATEWLLAAGIVGLGLLLFGLGEMLLPNGNTSSGAQAEHVDVARSASQGTR